MVELKGLEPSAFWMQTRRSSQLSYSPAPPGAYPGPPARYRASTMAAVTRRSTSAAAAAGTWPVSTARHVASRLTR